MIPELYKIMAQNQNSFWWNVVRCEIISDHIKKLNLSREAKVLEIGCSTGINLNMLQNLFSKVEACEYNEVARNYVEENFPINIKPVELPHHLPYENEQFDLILLCDVLEHVKDDKKTLEVIKSKLKTGGFLFLTVPAHQWLWSYADIASHHFRRYSKNTLQAIVDDAKFTSVYERYFMQILFPVAIAVRLTKNFFYKIKTRRRDDIYDYDTKQPNFLINSLLKAIFRIERKIIIPEIPGLSILKILQKN